MLDTVEAFCEVLCNRLDLSTEKIRHILAASLLQDLGHSPYSNSLIDLFPTFESEKVDEGLPADISRTTQALLVLEESEQFLSRLDLDKEALVSLIRGRSPWGQQEWLVQLLEGPLDFDRLAYVESDASRVGFQPNSSYLATIAKSLRFDERIVGRACISSEGAEPVSEFLLERSRLYTDIYLHPVKIAIETIMSSYISLVWSHFQLGLHSAQTKPASILEFLSWNDEHVDYLLTGVSFKAGTMIETFRQALIKNSFIVGEIELLEGENEPLDVIEERLGQLQHPCFPVDLVWVLPSSKLPSLEVYQPGRILVRERSRFRALEHITSIPLGHLTRPFRHQPLAIFLPGTLPRLLKEFKQAGLGLGRIRDVPIVCDFGAIN